MKFLIIGAGGTGGCIGGYLADHGEDVTFIARGSHLKAMKKEGLSLQSKRKGNFKIQPVRACTMEDYQGVPDVIFVCVKSYALEGILPFLKRTASPDTVILPILNGYGIGERIRREVKAVTADGCVYLFASIKEPGVIVQPTEIFRLCFGLPEETDPKGIERMKELEKCLQAAGIDAAYVSDIQREIVKKWSFVSPMGAAGLYYDSCAGDFQKPGEKRDFFLALSDEIQQIGEAIGIHFEEKLSDNAAAILDNLNPEAVTSLQRDAASGGQTEADGLIGEVVRLGQRYRTAVPYYEKVNQWITEKGI